MENFNNIPLLGKPQMIEHLPMNDEEIKEKAESIFNQKFDENIKVKETKDGHILYNPDVLKEVNMVSVLEKLRNEKRR